MVVILRDDRSFVYLSSFFSLSLSFLWIGAQFPQEKFLSYGRILTLHYYFLLMCILFSCSSFYLLSKRLKGSLGFYHHFLMNGSLLFYYCLLYLCILNSGIHGFYFKNSHSFYLTVSWFSLVFLLGILILALACKSCFIWSEFQ